TIICTFFSDFRPKLHNPTGRPALPWNRRAIDASIAHQPFREHMVMNVQEDPAASTNRKTLTKLIPWAAVLIAVILVALGVKIAWHKDTAALPSLQVAVPKAAPKPTPEPYLDITAKVIDDETGKPVERFALQGGMKQDGKVTWGFWMQSPGNYPGGLLTHRFSGRIGE